MNERYKELMERCDKYYELGMLPPNWLCDMINDEFPIRFYTDTVITFGSKERKC